ncbi:MAG: nucleotidyltransferase, partial [Dehalococcoidia bacterium]|nr:nucleotidyltransferase [Dehalococcoidia bacterium]
MTIPESQLSRWSDHGPQDTAKRTHTAIRRALEAYDWPAGVRYDVYLQGSYQNDTNISGDSDVDVVLELKSSIYHDLDELSDWERRSLALTLGPVTYGWNDFRRDALKAMELRFGKALIAQGNKTIKLKPNPGSLAADVVVCANHRTYTSRSAHIDGIMLYVLQDKRQIVNYPMLHYQNGAEKGRRTRDRYKRTVRMFKNARNRLLSDGRLHRKAAPSYFLECLLYNAPNECFLSGYQDTYVSIVNWMTGADLGMLVCQNGRQQLFGDLPEQWSQSNARSLSSGLADLW